MLNFIKTYTLTLFGINLTRLTEKCLNQLEVPKLTSTQDIDEHADFIVTAISTAVDKAIPTSKSGRPESQSVSGESLVLFNPTLPGRFWYLHSLGGGGG